MLAVAAKVD